MADKMTWEEERIAAARDFLGGYRVCEELLGVQRYERRRARGLDEDCKCDDILEKDEPFWRLRMYEVENTIAALPNGRVKILLYYRYIRGESVEHVSDLIGFSRRTGYRMLRRGLLMVGARLERLGISDRKHEK